MPEISGKPPQLLPPYPIERLSRTIKAVALTVAATGLMGKLGKNPPMLSIPDQRSADYCRCCLAPNHVSKTLKSIHPLYCWQWLKASPTPLVMGTAGLTLLLFAPLAWMAGKSYEGFNRIQQQEFRLRQLSDQITYYDEVLTMSARLNAATGDRQWEDRYHAAEPKLDAIIQESVQLAASNGDQDSDSKQTDAANQELVAMEQQSFKLMRDGDRPAAFRLLNGETYAQWKRQYTAGVTQRNARIQANLSQKIAEYQHHLITAIGISGISFLLLLPAWIMVLRVLRQYVQDLQQAQALLQADLKTTQSQVMQNEKLAAMGEMVAGVAHEINNPVGFIAGNLQPAIGYLDNLFQLLDLYTSKSSTKDPAILDLIEDIDLDFLRADFPQLISSMQLGIQRIEGISCSLRNLARADQAHKVMADLQTGLDGTILILRHRLKAHPDRPEIQVVTAFEGDCTMLCFPSQINQVFMNILANAIDAIDEKTSQALVANPGSKVHFADQIKIAVTRCDDLLTIVIQDTGGGMPASVRQQIFDHLFTTKAVGKGTGLGLVITQQIIVEHHQGTITVDSTMGVGTTFTIALPVQSAPAIHPINDATRSSTAVTTPNPTPTV
jgi:signal transduction histidine kinase